MIDAIIIDDEKKAITALKNDLETYCPDVQVLAVFTKASDALEFLQSHTVQVIFLDIDMPVMNGFDFVRELKQPIRSQIIFVSAYSEFAVRAFKVNALDYLLKPVDPGELQDAVKKVIDRGSAPPDQQSRVKNLVDHTAAENPKGKLALPVNNGYHLVDPVHIIYCKAAGAYTQIIMDNEKSFLISRNLGRTQELMPPDLFERVHQSYLVNLNHIKKFRKGESPEAIMINDDVIKVSRSNKDRLAQLLGIQ
ncbi:MAG: LytTR family DNA-binding domain-containing protein [Bacteroidota bacterium]